MARVLAHSDHEQQIIRAGGDLRPVRVQIAHAIGSPDAAAAWLIAQIAAGRDAVPGHPVYQLARHLARTETYGLARFLLAQRADSGVGDLARRYGLSVAQFNRRCHQLLGHAPKRELRRLRAARTLLDYPGRAHSFTHLAADHGYASLSHFCTDIKSLTGCSPAALYRSVLPSHD